MERQAAAEAAPFTSGVILKPAVETAKYAKYAKRERTDGKWPFTEKVRTSPSATCSVFAWFAYLAVTSAVFRIKESRCISKARDGTPN